MSALPTIFPVDDDRHGLSPMRMAPRNGPADLNAGIERGGITEPPGASQEGS